MRVLFVGSHRADKQYSIVGFEQALQIGLSGRCNFEVIRPGSGQIDEKGSKWGRYIEKYIVFPRRLRQFASKADIVHFCEKGMGMNVPHVRGHRTLVTVHDFLAVEAARGEFPGWDVSPSGQRYQALIIKAVMHADALACVSQTTLNAVKKNMPGYKGVTRLILNSMYKDFKHVEAADALSRIPALPFQRFFFHIGGNKPYKNRDGALRIYAEILARQPGIDVGLVMAGGSKTAELAALESTLGLCDKVMWVPEPTDAQVEAFYSLATALLFPSWAEGFGLPVIEAQACGCPVFASNRAPMTEIGESSVVYFDPSYPVESATQILAHMDNLEELRRRGYENVLRFDPKVMADKYLHYYEDLLSQ